MCSLAGVIYACICLSMFIIISYFGQMVKCVEFPCYLLNNNQVHKGTIRHCSGDTCSTTAYSICSEFYITGLKTTNHIGSKCVTRIKYITYTSCG